MHPVKLQNEHIALEVLPSLGGKIASLINRQSGREWLWKNPHLEPRPPIYGESYPENIDFGGWDEIYPSVSPVRLSDGAVIPDHGDLVFLPAEVSPLDDHTLTTTQVTRFMPTRFTRTITLVGSRIQVDYRLESLCDNAIPYLWACHPLISLESGMRLEVPTHGEACPFIGETAALPMTRLPSGGCCFEITDPDQDSSTHPVAQKLFTTAGSVSELTLHAPDGAALHLSWDVKDAPYLGLWVNLRGWSGCGSPPYFNLGIEPTTSPHDRLFSAIDHQNQRILSPWETHSWSLQFNIL